MIGQSGRVRVADLRGELDRLGIRANAYSLDGGMRDNRYAIERRGRTWYVYYSERGAISWEQLCASEEEACQMLVGTLRNDPTTQQS